jgi:hypothetical protein
LRDLAHQPPYVERRYRALDTNVGGVDRRRRSTSGVRSRSIIRILNGAHSRRVHMSPPILFVGSGLTRRYFSGPSWDELLAHLAAQCPPIEREYGYYKQTLVSPLLIGTEFARLYLGMGVGQLKMSLG